MYKAQTPIIIKQGTTTIYGDSRGGSLHAQTLKNRGTVWNASKGRLVYLEEDGPDKTDWQAIWNAGEAAQADVRDLGIDFTPKLPRFSQEWRELSVHSNVVSLAKHTNYMGLIYRTVQFEGKLLLSVAYQEYVERQRVTGSVTRRVVLDTNGNLVWVEENEAAQDLDVDVLRSFRIPLFSVQYKDDKPVFLPGTSHLWVMTKPDAEAFCNPYKNEGFTMRDIS